MVANNDAVISQINAVLEKFHDSSKRAQFRDLSDRPVDEAKHVETLMYAAIKRLSPPGSAYIQQANLILDSCAPPTPAYTVLHLCGILTALRDDYESGRLMGITELIHADLFSDMLSMAQYFVEDGYKDAAAVIGGSVLEEHLRKLCNKFGVPTVDASGGHKKAMLINAELRKAEAYGLTDDKAITAWLDIRNNAAHGKYDKYELGQVRLLVDGVRDFIRRHPA
ncbi:hypothetical protein WMF39_15225 [Sorangium sp. So ce1504]|uniref:hypothetical protein n=1 Tax=Sorangium sp. So ce1504 TaxID=3133337 RepID=UPI003F629261